MSKSEILKQLPKLTPRDRQEIRAKLNELDGLAEDECDDVELTSEQQTLVEERIAAYKNNPTPAISWPEAYAFLKARFKK